MQVSEMVIEKKFSLKEAWASQHPIIQAWCTLSAISFVFMYGMFFIAH